MASQLREDDEYLRVGDHIYLYSTESQGYVFCEQTNSQENAVLVYPNQDVDKPAGIANPHTVTFSIVIQNRYKLDKRYRQLCKEHSLGPFNLRIAKDLQDAKVAAEAEKRDNVSELRRLRGKKLKYGDVIQLHNVFATAYIHVNITKASKNEKGKFGIHLSKTDGKTAQFKILPKYKINLEGENVRQGDQVIFESVQSPGHYIHTSPPFMVGHKFERCELNIGASGSEYTIVKRFRASRGPDKKHPKQIWGGAVVQLYHKNMEAFLTAEGIFDREILKTAHMWVQEIDILCSNSLYAPSNCTTFWQLEMESSILAGEEMLWGQPIRIKHVPTRRYLYVDTQDGSVGLSEEALPNTIFRFHAMHKTREFGSVENGTYVRIQHVISGRWIHCENATFKCEQDDDDRQTRKKMVATEQKFYQDAFTVSCIPSNLLADCNFVIGIAPLFLNGLQELRSKGKLSELEMEVLNSALAELRVYVAEEDDMDEERFEMDNRRFRQVSAANCRRKMIQDLQVLTMCIQLLRIVNAMRDAQVERSFDRTVHAIYDLLLSFTSSNIESCLYISKYMDFFQERISTAANADSDITKLLVELLSNKRQVIEKITPKQIERLLNKSEHNTYLQLLRALCVCDGVAIPENQNYIGHRLLVQKKNKLFHFAYNGQDHKVYVWRKKTAEKEPIESFFKDLAGTSSGNEIGFLKEQLELFECLCLGRNQTNIEMIAVDYISFEVCLGVLESASISAEMKAMFCDLIITLFIDVGENTPLSDCVGNNYDYNRLDTHKTPEEWLNQQPQYVDRNLEERLPKIYKWLFTFLDENIVLVASEVKKNQLILAVLKLVYNLLVFGYISSKKADFIGPYIFDILKGDNDVPSNDVSLELQKVSKTKNSALRRDVTAKLSIYRSKTRYEKSEQNRLVADIKYQALLIVDHFLRLAQFFRCEIFMAHFKVALENDQAVERTQNPLSDLIYGTESRRMKLFLLFLRTPREELDRLFQLLLKEYIAVGFDKLVPVLKDLANYDCAKMTSKSLGILSREYSAKEELLKAAQRSQLLLHDKHCEMLGEIRIFMPLLMRTVAVKIHDDQIQVANAILAKFNQFCQVSDSERPETVSFVGQRMMVNQGVHEVLLKMLKMDKEGRNGASDVQFESLMRHSLKLLQMICHKNQYIQEFLFLNIDTLLDCGWALACMVETIKEIFVHNHTLCNRIEQRHVIKLQRITIENKQVTEIFEVILSLILMDGQTINKRNQYMFMKSALEQISAKSFRLFECPHQERVDILLSKRGQSLLRTFVDVICVLAVCAKDNAAHFLALGGNIMPIEETLGILNNRDLSNNLKRSFLKFLTWLNLSPTIVNSETSIVHSSLLWNFVGHLIGDITTCLKHLKKHKLPKRQRAGRAFVPEKKTDECFLWLTSHYLLDSVLPFIERMVDIFKYNSLYEREKKLLDKLIHKYIGLYPSIVGAVDSEIQLRTQTIMLENIMEKCGYGEAEIRDTLTPIPHKYEEVRHKDNMISDESPAELREVAINKKLRDFVTNVIRIQSRPNTVADQLGNRSAGNHHLEYTALGTATELPLKEDFQNLVQCFISDKSTNLYIRYEGVDSLIKQLEIASNLKMAGHYKGDGQLELTCLQVLRGLIHNNIVLVPTESAITSEKYKRRMKNIRKLQNLYTSKGLVAILCKLMALQNTRIFRECLALLGTILYSANNSVQDIALRFFISTREEVFFMFVKDYLTHSAIVTKERRQVEKKVKAEACHNEDSKSKSKKDHVDEYLQDAETHGENIGKLHDTTVQLILQVLANFCDGHHRGMQDYCREQPDNLHGFNLVASVAQYTGVLYTKIDPDSIDLAHALFKSLNDMCAGNQENRHVTLDNKIVDYINFILRRDSFSDCPIGKVLKLYKIIADLLISLIEESGPEAMEIATDIANTLDINALNIVISRCYAISQMAKWSRFNHRNTSFKHFAIFDNDKSHVTLAKKVGCQFYIVYARLHDVRKEDLGNLLEEEKQHDVVWALDYYQSRIHSVEIIKDDYLQRAYFYVPDSNLIRNEIKEKLKWNIDRSSPSMKIRDFMLWSKVIIRDISYHQKVISNPITKIICNKRKMWNVFIIFLSVVINIFMLCTWIAPFTADDVSPTASDLPREIRNPWPIFRIDKGVYDKALMGLGIVHNCFSLLVLISYFLSEHPRLPDTTRISRWFGKHFGSVQERGDIRLEDDMREPKDTSRESETRFFSFATFYQFTLLAMSIGGTLTDGYLFAFHLLHIVTINELLQGVIRAVTQNGKSLLWVAVLGFIVLYIYALVGFAFFRPVFISKNELYCRYLYECTVTVLRWGMTDMLPEIIQLNELSNSFYEFGLLTLYQVTFFIFFTTIGLNIIFGIIVDTFSELRDTKYQAGKDMQDLCFICSISSYEFEHHSKGFRYHYKQEHNMWSYMYYFIYLENTNSNDYTALDYYVANLKREMNYDFFPTNRALCLSSRKHNEEDPRIREMATNINYLLEKQRQQEIAEKQNREEKDQARILRKIVKHNKSQSTALGDISSPTQATDKQDGRGSTAGPSAPQPEKPPSPSAVDSLVDKPDEQNILHI